MYSIVMGKLKAKIYIKCCDLATGRLLYGKQPWPCLNGGIIFTGRGVFVLGGPNFFLKIFFAPWAQFYKSKGGTPEFFPIGKGGTRLFLYMQKGDQKKLVTGHHKQTYPLPVKNGSSLKIPPWDIE